jgi:4-amino-4-deoxy-L-arabinose transferase-like glycosyltransferase
VETHPPAPQPPAKTHFVARIAWTLLIVVTLYVCYFSNLGIIGFVGPDEPRYASIARDMAETGDWITPRLYGKPWFEKPPLYYWGAALSFKLFGVSEAVARLPSAICALLATLALGWLALRLYGGLTARWLLLLLPTTVGMIGFSHSAATDMPFSATLTIAMVPAAILLGLIPDATTPTFLSLTSLTSSTSFTSLLFGFFLGLAMLAKGPAAIVLSGGAVLLWALYTQRWRDTLRLLHPAGIAAFCVTSLPWYIVCAYRNPSFLRIFLIEHNFNRFLTPEFQHIRPLWFYAEIILLGFLPWTAALVWALAFGFRRVLNRSLSASTSFLLAWALFCVVFFTISRSKLPGYILPAVPPLALIICRAATSPTLGKRRSLALAALATAALFGGAFVLLLKGADQLLKNLVAFTPLLELVLLFFAVANLFLGAFYLFSRRSAAIIAPAVTLLLAFQLMDFALEMTPLSVLSPRYLATQIQVNQLPLDALRVSNLRRATRYGLNFYLRTDLQEWNHDPSREVYVLTTGSLGCSVAPEGMTCSDLLGFNNQPGSFALLHLTPLHP